MTTFLEHVSYVILNVHEIIFKMRGHLPIFGKKIFLLHWGVGRCPNEAKNGE